MAVASNVIDDDRERQRSARLVRLQDLDEVIDLGRDLRLGLLQFE